MPGPSRALQEEKRRITNKMASDQAENVQFNKDLGELFTRDRTERISDAGAGRSRLPEPSTKSAKDALFNAQAMQRQRRDPRTRK